MRFVLYILFVAAGCLLSSFIMQQEGKLHQAAWLLGTWKNTVSGKISYETWRRENAFTYNAQAYRLNGHDTIVSETIKLMEEKDGLLYMPTVRNQNQGTEIRFYLKAFNDSSMLFENQAHDFPKRIQYRKINADSIVAEISGNGKQIRFEMTRVKL